ncbi:hypothetical protein QE152_g24929 [Popillia japonica]|uniref:Uncharacterized protein n=1 Tax=Popillia japonica TaxID=7064 RepID=A0AAW1K373_POPJA
MVLVMFAIMTSSDHFTRNITTKFDKIVPTLNTYPPPPHIINYFPTDHFTRNITTKFDKIVPTLNTYPPPPRRRIFHSISECCPSQKRYDDVSYMFTYCPGVYVLPWMPMYLCTQVDCIPSDSIRSARLQEDSPSPSNVSGASLTHDPHLPSSFLPGRARSRRRGAPASRERRGAPASREFVDPLPEATCMYCDRDDGGPQLAANSLTHYPKQLEEEEDVCVCGDALSCGITWCIIEKDWATSFIV